LLANFEFVIEYGQENEMNEDKIINLKLSDYPQRGLCLILKDSTKVTFTREHIEKTAEEYWNNPDKIPPKVKSAIEFERCPFCYLKGKDDFCDAIRPILPFLEIVDKYVSFDEVVAIYKEDDSKSFHIADTTMQEGLKYVSLISLMHYCQIGRAYWKYYMGIMPLKGGKEAAIRMYLNIYQLHKGNNEEIDKLIATFIGQLRVTSQNQVKRMNLICRNDAFMNAFVNTQIATEFLSMGIDKATAKAFEEHDKDIVGDPKTQLKV